MLNYKYLMINDKKVLTNINIHHILLAKGVEGNENKI